MRMYVAYNNKTRFCREYDSYFMHYSMDYIVQNMTSKSVLSRNVSCQYSSKDFLDERVALATFQRTNLVLVIIAQVTRQSSAERGIGAVDRIDDLFPVRPFAKTHS